MKRFKLSLFVQALSYSLVAKVDDGGDERWTVKHCRDWTLRMENYDGSKMIHVVVTQRPHNLDLVAVTVEAGDKPCVSGTESRHFSGHEDMKYAVTDLETFINESLKY